MYASPSWLEGGRISRQTEDELRLRLILKRGVRDEYSAHVKMAGTASIEYC